MRRLVLAGCLLVSAVACSSGGDPSSVPDLALQQVATGLDFPLFLTTPPRDDRLFVVERYGRIRIIRDGQLLAEPFLDVSSLISTAGEQGLMGFAFDPAYAANGRFLVSYSEADGDLVVASYRASADADVADASSAVVRLRVPHPEPTHYSGMLAFGPDGHLYVGVGDGGAPGDFAATGQDRSDLLGSILRIDVPGDVGYDIPAGNPYVDSAGIRHEIWSYGVRNPWRFSFDRATGDLYIGDVGEDQREELDVAAAANDGGRGMNFGWSVAEGLTCARGDECDRDGFTDPVLDYTHDDGCSITGGYAYRGRALAGLEGNYFYGDFCGGWVRSVRVVNGRVTQETRWPSLDTGANITSFGEDADGELYVLTADGTVSRIVAATSEAPASRTSRSAP
ncbi:MAG TPA: PQQ-dependent sugar dehydrogenase [Gemmatimonadales bacterium]|nr:PQQ-dependent sugar dehydrogenase [Gemmatimonadales bacterium]